MGVPGSTDSTCYCAAGGRAILAWSEATTIEVTVELDVLELEPRLMMYRHFQKMKIKNKASHFKMGNWNATMNKTSPIY